MGIPNTSNNSKLQESKRNMELLNVYHDKQDKDWTFIPRIIYKGYRVPLTSKSAPT